MNSQNAIGWLYRRIDNRLWIADVKIRFVNSGGYYVYTYSISNMDLENVINAVENELHRKISLFDAGEVGYRIL